MAASDPARQRRPAGVWVSAAITLLLLAVTDVALAAWHRWPQRLPEHFSSSYLAFQRKVADATISAVRDSKVPHVVLLSSAAIFVVAGRAANLTEGLTLATQSIDEGRAPTPESSR